MITSDLIDYYAKLLILQYVGKPKAFATIQTLVTPVIMDQLPIGVQNAFKIGTAVGVQLDVIGKYVGVIRSGSSLNGSAIELDDNDFTGLIKLAIIRNNSGSSLATIQELLQSNFPSQILVFDYANMRMSYYLNSSIGSQDLAQLFVTEGLLPKPMGVQLASVIYSPHIFKFFGFRTYDIPAANVSPVNNYDTYNTDYPWLTYSDALGA